MMMLPGLGAPAAFQLDNNNQAAAGVLVPGGGIGATNVAGAMQHAHQMLGQRAFTLPDMGTNGGLRNIFGSFDTSNSNDTSLTFHAPAETLLDRNHNETLAKLNFVLALTDCIVEVADTKCTPLAALMAADVTPTTTHSPDNCDRYDRLVLLLR